MRTTSLPQALADTVDDLFIRQHALAARAPVDGHGGLIGQTVLIHLQEDPLRPLIVARIGRIDRTVPVEAVAEHFELAGEVFDVPLGDDGRMDVVLDGEVLRRQAESVEADRVQDIIALHPLFAADDVHRGERARMADVQARGGRVRELDQRVEFRLGMVDLGMEGILVLPDLLPFGLNCFKVVFHKFLPTDKFLMGRNLLKAFPPRGCARRRVSERNRRRRLLARRLKVARRAG